MGTLGIFYDNDKITFTKRITGTTETNVFVCPYGQGVRFKLDKLMAYNEAGSATTIKVFDHVQAVSVTDPPAQGDSTTPLFTWNLTSPSASVTGMLSEGADKLPEINFQQGMAVVASQANVQIVATVVEV